MQDDLQYKIEATAEIYNSDTLFEEIKNNEYTVNLHEVLKVNDNIIIKLISIEQSNGKKSKQELHFYITTDFNNFKKEFI